jgi:TonB family protein
MGRLFLGLAILAAATSPALAQDRPPDWRDKPTSDQLLAVWPRQALDQGLQGQGVIHCKVSVQGALFGCQAVSETPPGSGFAAAALALAPQFSMTPMMHNGVAVAGGEITIPVNFSDPGVSSGASAEAGGGGQRMIANVVWSQAPTYAQVVAAYPPKARAAGAGGHVVLNCRFNRQGRLNTCDVTSEDPQGLGFGKAAKSLVADFVGPHADSASGRLINVWTQIAFTFDPAMLTDAAPVIGKPGWTRMPEAAAFAAGFPAAATAAHVSVGHVTLACQVADAGRLADCSVARQDPEGLGFDKAAMAVAGGFQVSVWTPEGLPTVGGRIRVPIRYEAGPPAEAAKP